jgi:sulfate adenylyltransferase
MHPVDKIKRVSTITQTCSGAPLYEGKQEYTIYDEEGYVLFFTGLSGSGKSTLANELYRRYSPDMDITLLDGDIVRNLISSELGFSQEHRNLNIRRIGYIASEIVKHRGIVICAAIAPYKNIRDEIRELVPEDKFILVHVSTPLEICALRDPKGLYAKAYAGELKHFTGISDPYEPPEYAELQIDTTDRSIDDCINEIIQYLDTR